MYYYKSYKLSANKHAQIDQKPIEVGVNDKAAYNI